MAGMNKLDYKEFMHNGAPSLPKEDKVLKNLSYGSVNFPAYFFRIFKCGLSIRKTL